ncbi:MAG: OmpH family outer membrane protein [Betaproteobacteria bacterium]
MPAYRRLLPITAAALLALPALACAEDYKIGVINTDRILRESTPAKEAAKKIEQEFQARETTLRRLERELRDLTAKLDREGATMTRGDQATLQRDVDMRGRELERSRRQLTEDLKGRQFDEMSRIKDRLDAVLTKLAKDQGYDLILQDGLFVRRSVDITDAVIKALEAR